MTPGLVTIPSHDPSPHSDCCTACGLPIRAWGDGCSPSTDDCAEACAEIRRRADVE